MSIGEQIHLVIAAILGPMILYALLCAPAEPKSYGESSVKREATERIGEALLGR